MIAALGQSDCSYERIWREIRRRRAKLETGSLPDQTPEQIAAIRFIMTCCLPQTSVLKNASLEQDVIRAHFHALEHASVGLRANPEQCVVYVPENSPCNTGPMLLVTLLRWGTVRESEDNPLEETHLWRELSLKIIEIAKQTRFTEFYPQCRVLEMMTYRYCYTMKNLESFASVYPIQLPVPPLKPALHCELTTCASMSDWRLGIDMREKEGITYEEGTEPNTILVSDSVVRGWIESKFHEDVMAACCTVPEFALWPPGLLQVVVSFTSYLRHIPL